MIDDPDTQFAGITLPATQMSRNGWRRPMIRNDDGIIDVVAVERSLCWELLPLTTREVVAVIARGAERGYSDADLADRLGMSERHVARTRAAWNIPTRYVPEGPSPRPERIAARRRNQYAGEEAA